MLNTIKFSEFPLEFSRPLVSLFFFVWISPVVLSLFWSVMPTKGHCTIAKSLLMLSWSFLFWTPCEAMLSFMHQTEILSPVLSGPLTKIILENAELLPSIYSSTPFEPLNIPSQTDNFMPVIVEGNHIYFSLLLQLGKFLQIFANFYPNLHLIVDSCVIVFKPSRFKLKSLLTFWPLEKNT